MIEFTHETTRYTVKPENAQEYRKQAANPPKIKRKVDRNHDATRRDYPQFYAGMTTADYVSQYAGLNSRLLLKGEGFTFADRAAPMLDATQPEALEELDADYVPPAWAPKAKPATAAQLRAALAGLVAAIENGGDIQAATAAAKAVL
jgi:hypothetical protein